MSKNFKQAFNEVFRKEKNESPSETCINESNKDESVTEHCPIPYNFDGFEEIKPTGKTMSDADKALIDKKAEEFAKTFEIKTLDKTKQEQKPLASEQDSSSMERLDNHQPAETSVIIRNVPENVDLRKSSNLSECTKNGDDTKPINENKSNINYRYYDFKAQAKNSSNAQYANEEIEKIKDNRPNSQIIEDVNNKNNIVYPYSPAYTLKPIATTFIDETTKIDGSIFSQSNLNISGEINGNITCNNDITATGKIIGNIDCENFVGEKVFIEGNVNTKKALILKNNSTVVGDISAEDIELTGKVTGNIVSSSEISILSNSSVYGDIDAKSIFVEKGSVIQGKVNIIYE